MQIACTSWSRWLAAIVAAWVVGCAGPTTSQVGMPVDAALTDAAATDAIDAAALDAAPVDAAAPDAAPIDAVPIDAAPGVPDPLDPTAAPAQCADRPSAWPPPPPPPPPPAPHASLTTFVNPADTATVLLINTTSAPVGPIWFDGAYWSESPWSTVRQGMTLGPNESITVPRAIHIHTPGQALDVPPLPPPPPPPPLPAPTLVLVPPDNSGFVLAASPATITVRNDGAATTPPLIPELTGTATITGTTCGTLAPHEACSVTILPLAVTSVTLRVAYTGSDGLPVSATLTLTAEVPRSFPIVITGPARTESPDGRFHCVGPGTCTFPWPVSSNPCRLQRSVWTPPGINVVTSCSDSQLTVDAAPDPHVAWTAPIDLAYGAAISPAGRVAVLDGPSQYPWPAGPAMLRVFDVDGTPLLQRALTGQPAVLTARGAGFAIATRGSVEALDGVGASLWRRPVPTMPSMRISGGPNGHVYVLGYTTNHYHLTAFGPDGATLWTRESPVPDTSAFAIGVDGLGLGILNSTGLARWSPSGGETMTVAPTWPTGFPCGTPLPHGLVGDVQLLGDGGRVAVCYPYSSAGQITVRAIDDDGTVRGPDTTTTAAAFIGGGLVVYEFRSRCGNFGILTSEGVRSYAANGGLLRQRTLASLGIGGIYVDDSALGVHAGFDINAAGQMVVAADGRLLVTQP